MVYCLFEETRRRAPLLHALFVAHLFAGADASSDSKAKAFQPLGRTSQVVSENPGNFSCIYASSGKPLAKGSSVDSFFAIPRLGITLL